MFLSNHYDPNLRLLYTSMCFIIHAQIILFRFASSSLMV